MTTVLVTGFSGLLAPYIVNRLKNEFLVVSSSRSSGNYLADITNVKQVKIMLNKVNPDVIVHCAAFTDVDEAEKKPDLAFLINENGTKNLVDNIKNDVHFIYISTDQVFPDNPGPHLEGTEKPINNYGKSKFKGSKIVENLIKKHTICQTNIFGPSINKTSKSFSDNIIKKLSNNENINLFSDIYFSPLHLKSFSDIIEQLIKKNIYGKYNIGSRIGMSKGNFITKIANHLNLSLKHTKNIRTKDIQRKAKRAYDLRLDTTKIEEALNYKMPDLDKEILKL